MLATGYEWMGNESLVERLLGFGGIRVDGRIRFGWPETGGHSWG